MLFFLNSAATHIYIIRSGLMWMCCRGGTLWTKFLMLLGAIEQLRLRAVGRCCAVRCGLRMQSYAEPMWRRLLLVENVAANHTKCEHNVWAYVIHAVAEWGKGAFVAKPINRSRLVHADLQRGKAALMAIHRACTHAKAEQGKCVAVCADCRLQA